ncbi:uncharacterized protein LOC143041327 [Oratosquilla oratoria]|uniref:uncharacterized protein LOC143041327 n=1 Tax=Oratosquilla oratoria TaxID=337810 RepID=UPI003F75AC07
MDLHQVEEEAVRDGRRVSALVGVRNQRRLGRRTKGPGATRSPSILQDACDATSPACCLGNIVLYTCEEKHSLLVVPATLRIARQFVHTYRLPDRRQSDTSVTTSPNQPTCQVLNVNIDQQTTGETLLTPLADSILCKIFDKAAHREKGGKHEVLTQIRMKAAAEHWSGPTSMPRQYHMRSESPHGRTGRNMKNIDVGGIKPLLSRAEIHCGRHQNSKNREASIQISGGTV